MSGRRTLALVLWIGATAAGLLAFLMIVAMRDVQVPTSWGFPGAASAFGLTCATVGAIVARRRPENLNGWLFCAIGALFAAEGLINQYVIAGVLVVPGDLPLTTFFAWTLAWIWVPPLGIALIFLPLVFPTGHLLSPRWRVAAAFGVVAVVVFCVIIAFLPGPIEQATFVDNPLGGVTGLSPEAYASRLLGPAWLPLAIAIVLGLASLVVRFRRATGDARRQIKWFALAALVAGALFTIYLTVSVLIVSGLPLKMMEVLVVIGLLGLPTAAGMAILRYRLYDIDRIVSRTISYGIVTALLVAVFLLVNLALQGLLSSVISSNSLTVAASTLLVAALFTPLRRRVQRAVDRRFDRARYDAGFTVAAFADRLRNEVDLPTLSSELNDTVRQAISPSSVNLWLRGGGQ